MTALLLAAVAVLAAGSIHSTVTILKELHIMSQSLDNLKSAVTRLETTAAAAIAGKTPDAELDAVTTRVNAVSDALAAATPAPTPTPGA